MKFLKDYWFLFVFNFGLGLNYGLIQTKLDDINKKLDIKYFYNIREKDSLRNIIRDKEMIRIKREVNPKAMEALAAWRAKRAAEKEAAEKEAAKPAGKAPKKAAKVEVEEEEDEVEEDEDDGEEVAPAKPAKAPAKAVAKKK
jgi:pantothenate synthetase